MHRRRFGFWFRTVSVDAIARRSFPQVTTARFAEVLQAALHMDVQFLTGVETIAIHDRDVWEIAARIGLGPSGRFADREAYALDFGLMPSYPNGQRIVSAYTWTAAP